MTFHNTMLALNHHPPLSYILLGLLLSLSLSPPSPRSSPKSKSKNAFPPAPHTLPLTLYPIPLSLFPPPPPASRSVYPGGTGHCTSSGLNGYPSRSVSIVDLGIARMEKSKSLWWDWGRESRRGFQWAKSACMAFSASRWRWVGDERASFSWSECGRRASDVFRLSGGGDDCSLSRWRCRSRSRWRALS